MRKGVELSVPAPKPFSLCAAAQQLHGQEIGFNLHPKLQEFLQHYPYVCRIRPWPVQWRRVERAAWRGSANRTRHEVLQI